MTKTDLANAVRKSIDGDCSQREAVDLVESVLELVKETLFQGEAIKIAGFGKFDVREKKPRMGRNPKTKEPMLIEARRVVKFTVSEKLRGKINGDGGEDP